MPSVSVFLRGKKISVSEDNVSVSIKKAERVTWTSGDGDFQIDFQSGIHPANPRTTKNGSVWEASSGPFAAVTKIKYGITASERDPLDPEIEVFP
jgi:hypothetical protein